MSHVEKEEEEEKKWEKGGVGGGGEEEEEILQSTERNFHGVSPGMGEMKCELREWEGTRERWRMEIMRNEHNTAIDSERETERDWTRVTHRPVPVPLAKQCPWCSAGLAVHRVQAERKWLGSPGFARDASPAGAASRSPGLPWSL